MPAELIVHAMLLFAVVALLVAVVLAIPMIFYDLRRDLDFYVEQDAVPGPGPYDQVLDGMLSDDERLFLLSRGTRR